ncbi:MAG: hypothetical protein KA257_08400 [Opitutaceae bacterium]|nr:hypothetical protein [Opitutaceae bacterium]MBP9912183.1 hypothetical protein [Opitutaceae bacterium]
MSPADDARPIPAATPGRMAARLKAMPAWLIASLATLLLAGLLFSPANTVMDIQLDASNYGSYAFFTARHFQYGSEVVPMAGPYGFVPYGFTYAGSLFGERLGLELLTKLVLGGLIVWFFHRARSQAIQAWLWLCSVVVLTPVITDLPYILAILLSGLFLTTYYSSPGRTSSLACSGVAGYLALLTLFKGTQTMLALAVLGLLLLQAIGTRHFRRLAWILSAYVAALLGLWLAAGQSPRHLPGYLHGILELSAGYNLAMGLDETMVTFTTGLLVLVALLALVLLAYWPQRRKLACATGGLLLGGVIFVLWKHGFVRADGHVLIFFQFAPILALTVRLQLASDVAPVWSRRTALGLLGFILMLSLWADGKNLGARLAWNFTSLPARWAETATQLFAPMQAKARLTQALAVQRRDWQLPRLKQIVGPASVDFFGNELGYLLLNRFNYQPRPMGGGTFNVFTPWLHDLNAAHVGDALTRPDYFVVNFQTIDERFAAQDDSGTLLALLHGYTPIEINSGLILFKAAPAPPAMPAPELIATLPFTWGEPVPVPSVPEDEMLLMSFEAPPNLAGRLRRALYKPPLIFMDLSGSGIGQPADRRVIPVMFQHPVVLNPVLESNVDLLDLIAGLPGKTARTLVLKTRSAEFFDRDGLRIHFYRMPRPPRVPRPPVTLSHPLVSAVDPKIVESTVNSLAREEGLVYQIFVPPSRLGYTLQGDETELRFTYGMTAVSYERPNDGVELFVDLQRPGQPPQLLFQQHHTPRQQPSQRGPQSVRLTLPPLPPGSILNLRTGRGPDQDGAWDLVYLTGIAFTHGPFTTAQFPGFALLPQSVTAGNCGRYPDNGREIFLLNAPGALTFALPESARSFQFKVGLLPGAYTGAGNSDGIEITAELRTAQGTLKRLFHHQLNPRSTPGDRGDQTFDVALPELASATQLILTLGPGPAGDASWDWSYIAGISLH